MPIEGDRTSRLLLAVLLLFLLTELPQGILGLLTVFLGDRFFEECYVRLGELMDLLALTSSTLNFPLYCLMSRQFRAAFGAITHKALDKVSANITKPLVKEDKMSKGQLTCGSQL